MAQNMDAFLDGFPNGWLVVSENFRDGESAIKGVTAYATEREAVQAALRKTEALLRSGFSQASPGLYVYQSVAYRISVESRNRDRNR